MKKEQTTSESLSWPLEMAAELGISERSVQRILNSMPDIRFTGGGRSGHWEISDPQE